MRDRSCTPPSQVFVHFPQSPHSLQVQSAENNSTPNQSILVVSYYHLSPGPEQGKSLHGSNSLESPWHDLPPYLASSRTFLDLCLIPPTHDLEQGLQIVHSSHLQSNGEQFTMRPSVAGTKVFCPSTCNLYFQTWSASDGHVSACSVCAIFQHCTFFLRLLMVYA